MNPQMHDDLDRLIDLAARDLAHAPVPHALAERLKQRSLALNHTTSTAIPCTNVLLFTTVDRTRRDRDSRTFAGAALLHAAALLLVVFTVRAAQRVVSPGPQQISLVTPMPLPAIAPRAHLAGGGGGQKGPTPVTKGNPPKFAAHQLLPPAVPPVEQPKLAVEPSVDVQSDIHMAKVDVPQFGMPNSPLVGMSLGDGKGRGLGSGAGDGIGPGSGGNMGGGLRRIGGGVSAPEVLFQPEAEFSEEARKAKVSGNVLVYLQVDTQGRPEHVRVLRGIGLGLDEKAVAAVKQYKFKPAMENGRPVPVEMNIEVNFTIY